MVSKLEFEPTLLSFSGCSLCNFTTKLSITTFPIKFWTGIIVLIALYLLQGRFVINIQREKILPATVHYKIP
jgi:hypothetical protein